VGELKDSNQHIEELKALKSRFPDLAQSRINEKERDFVKTYTEENEGTSMEEAQKVFRQLTKGII